MGSLPMINIIKLLAGWTLEQKSRVTYLFFSAQTQGEMSLLGKESMPLLQQEAKQSSCLCLGQVREDSLQ